MAVDKSQKWTLTANNLEFVTFYYHIKSCNNKNMEYQINWSQKNHWYSLDMCENYLRFPLHCLSFPLSQWTWQAPAWANFSACTVHWFHVRDAH